MSERDKTDVIAILKEWASPILIGIVGMLIWRDMNELRSDVKLMIVQVSINTSRINNLETENTAMKSAIFRLTLPEQDEKK